MKVEYLFTDGAKILHQYYWDKLKKVTFYNAKYCGGNNHNNMVCIWKIKLKK